jgi:dUTP pyrophosphatase
MITIQVKNIEGKTILPIAGSQLAAGYDIVAVEEPTIVGTQLPPSFEEPDWWKAIDYLEYHTALYISPEPRTMTIQQMDFGTGKYVGGPTTNVIENYHTLLHPRSSIRKYNLVLANSIGLVDNDYRGEIIMCFKYIFQPEDLMFGDVSDKAVPDSHVQMILGRVNPSKVYKKGDKIGQLVAEPTNPMTFQLVSELGVTARGEGGFGSTDMQGQQDTKQQAPAKTIVQTEGVFGTIAEAYQQSGGVPIKKRYIDEIKERERMVTHKPSANPMPLKTGIHERKG